ncbi:hypothetical protein DdX_20291 [Ditylenchus destructor]|uniref:Uncharacterized protein n=1 Tax=Ditylenchus destructor TaxID=166010 RepID=A0AAD4MIZ2_9BILA|nr:hypothetical protein DdX_20291 [Ditylenchus destructor]
MASVTNIEIPSTSNGPVGPVAVNSGILANSARKYKTQSAPSRPVASGQSISVQTNSAPVNENSSRIVEKANGHSTVIRHSPGPILPKPTISNGAMSSAAPTAKRKTSSNSSSMTPLEEYTFPPDSIQSQGSWITGCTADTSFGSLSAKSSTTEDESRCASKEDNLHTWRLFPVPNNHALVAALSVIAYSIVFLFYAQRHRVILLAMTGLIAVFITFLYAFGVLSLLYTMHHIARMEKKALEESADCDQNSMFKKRSESNGGVSSGENSGTVSGNSTFVLIETKQSKTDLSIK